MPLDLVGLETTWEQTKQVVDTFGDASGVNNDGGATIHIMGRWKRKKEVKKKQQQPIAVPRTVSNGGGGDDRVVEGGVAVEDDEKARDWVWQERSDLSRYLDDYRIGCIEQLFRSPFHQSSEQQEQEQQQQQQEQQHGVLIGGILFPALTPTVLQEPYLELPRHLTRKHRRMIHEVCVEAMLFHRTAIVANSTTLNTLPCNDTATTTFPVALMELNDDYGDGDNDNDNDDDGNDDAQPDRQPNQDQRKSSSKDSRDDDDGRYIVISIYADGFDSIPAASGCPDSTAQQQQQQQVLQGLNILKYKPWYCRKERCHSKDEDENHGSSGNNKTDTSTSTTSTVSTSTAAAMVATAINDIDHLVDQPGECLREGIDEVDYEKWDDKDLSTMPPPTCNDDDGDSSASWLLVDSIDKMQQCIAELQQAVSTITELGFDLEAYNPSKYAQVTCLLQITTNLGRDYIIDTLAPGVWDLIGPGLAPLFANPNIVKVGHSIGGLDIRCLHRDFGILVVNVFDTYEASKVSHLSSHGLASVCAHYGLLLHENEEYTNLKATYQTCDWRRRPLTRPMIQYGRYDVHYLLQLRHLMMRDLTRHDLWDTTPVQHDATSRLVALALQKTLAQFAQEDEDDYYYHENGDFNCKDNNSNQQDDDDNENSDWPNPNEATGSTTAETDDDNAPPPPDAAARGPISKEEEENGRGDDPGKSHNGNDNGVADSDDEDGGNEAFYTPRGSMRSLATGLLGLEEDSDDDDRGDGGSLVFRTPPMGSTRKQHDNDVETSDEGKNDVGEKDGDENGDVDDEENGNDREPIASVPVLRLQPKLMAVLSQSQERCRDLWSGRSEPASSTRTLLNIQRRSKQQRIRQNNKKRRLKNNNGLTTVEEEDSNHLLLPYWTEQNDRLYHALVAWRDQVAREWEVLPGLVIPLDMLVPIAWQCPQTRPELQRIRFDLPAIFFYNEGQYMNELLNLVKRQFPFDQNELDGHGNNASKVYLYATRATVASVPLPIEENDKPTDANFPTVSVSATHDDNKSAANRLEDDIGKDAMDVQDESEVTPAAAAARSSSTAATESAATEETTCIPLTKSPSTADNDDDNDADNRDEISEDSAYRWHRVAWIVAGVAVIVLIAVRTSRGSGHRGSRR
jgi:ribonuclease D